MWRVRRLGLPEDPPLDSPPVDLPLIDFVAANAALTNLDGLSSLTTVGDSLHIYGNGALCEASVLALAAGWTVGGSQNIWNNTGACP